MAVRLKRALESKGITVKGCADLLNVSEKTLNNKMAGRTDFTFKEICTLKTFLPEYDISYLLSDTGQDSA